MQSSEIRRDSRVLPLILAAVVVSLILAVLMWMVASQSSGPASLSPVSNLVPVPAFRAGMGDLRAVDIVNSAPADMGSPKTTQASGSFYAGMGDLKVLETGVGSISAMGMTVGMGDIRMDREPSVYPEPRAYPGMGDIHAVE